MSRFVQTSFCTADCSSEADVAARRIKPAQTDTPSDQSQPQLTNDDQNLGLKHPPWTPLITRIPKAARSACALTLSKILGHIVADKSQLAAWESLFAIGPTVLAKPVRGGSNRNLTNAVLKNLASCSDTPSYKTVPSRQPSKLSRSRETSMLAAAISNKVEAGTFRARSDYFAPKRQSHQALMKPMRRSKPNTRRHHQIADQRSSLKETHGLHLFKCHRKTSSRTSKLSQLDHQEDQTA